MFCVKRFFIDHMYLAQKRRRDKNIRLLNYTTIRINNAADSGISSPNQIAPGFDGAHYGHRKVLVRRAGLAEPCIVRNRHQQRSSVLTKDPGQLGKNYFKANIHGK